MVDSDEHSKRVRFLQKVLGHYGLEQDDDRPAAIAAALHELGVQNLEEERAAYHTKEAEAQLALEKAKEADTQARQAESKYTLLEEELREQRQHLQERAEALLQKETELRTLDDALRPREELEAEVTRLSGDLAAERSAQDNGAPSIRSALVDITNITAEHEIARKQAIAAVEVMYKEELAHAESRIEELEQELQAEQELRPDTIYEFFADRVLQEEADAYRQDKAKPGKKAEKMMTRLVSAGLDKDTAVKLVIEFVGNDVIYQRAREDLSQKAMEVDEKLTELRSAMHDIDMKRADLESTIEKGEQIDDEWKSIHAQWELLSNQEAYLSEFERAVNARDQRQTEGDTTPENCDAINQDIKNYVSSLGNYMRLVEGFTKDVARNIRSNLRLFLGRVEKIRAEYDAKCVAIVLLPAYAEKMRTPTPGSENNENKSPQIFESGADQHTKSRLLALANTATNNGKAEIQHDPQIGYYTVASAVSHGNSRVAYFIATGLPTEEGRVAEQYAKNITRDAESIVAKRLLPDYNTLTLLTTKMGLVRDQLDNISKRLNGNSR